MLSLYRNDHLLTDLLAYDGKRNKLFVTLITEIKKIAHLTQHPGLQVA